MWQASHYHYYDEMLRKISMTKIQQNKEGYLFVFPGNKRCEQCGISKGDKVDVSVRSNEIRIRKVLAAPTAKSELQGTGITPSEDVNSHAS